MKPHGTRSDYETQRFTELLQAFRECMRKLKTTNMPDIYKAVVMSPTSRFWVSEERTAIVLSRMEHGDQLDEMRPQKKEMFCEIYRRCLKLKEREPDLSWLELATKVVAQPAPRWYLAPDSARLLIYKAKRWIKSKTSH